MTQLTEKDRIEGQVKAAIRLMDGEYDAPNMVRSWQPKKWAAEDKWLLDLFDLLGSEGYIAGSFAVWASLNNQAIPNDLDVFCRAEFDHPVLLARFINAKFIIHTVTEYAYTFKRDDVPFHVQVVIPQVTPVSNRQTWGEPEKLILDFDLSVCQAALLSPTSGIITDWCIADTRSKYIRITNHRDPLATASRLMRYSRKGFEVSTREMAALFDSWAAMSEDDRDELMDYLYPEHLN